MRSSSGGLVGGVLKLGRGGFYVLGEFGAWGIGDGPGAGGSALSPVMSAGFPR